jgi:hypothetical protein
MFVAGIFGKFATFFFHEMRRFMTPYIWTICDPYSALHNTAQTLLIYVFQILLYIIYILPCTTNIFSVLSSTLLDNRSRDSFNSCGHVSYESSKCVISRTIFQSCVARMSQADHITLSVRVVTIHTTSFSITKLCICVFGIAVRTAATLLLSGMRVRLTFLIRMSCALWYRSWILRII